MILCYLYFLQVFVEVICFQHSLSYMINFQSSILRSRKPLVELREDE